MSVIRYKEFVDKEFIAYSNSDNVRSIPNIMDGFKPG
jgi:DNA topoisomerase-2